jgi:hypothetical protein
MQKKPTCKHIGRWWEMKRDAEEAHPAEPELLRLGHDAREEVVAARRRPVVHLAVKVPGRYMGGAYGVRCMHAVLVVHLAVKVLEVPILVVVVGVVVVRLALLAVLRRLVVYEVVRQDGDETSEGESVEEHQHLYMGGGGCMHLVDGRFMEGSWKVRGRFVEGSWKVQPERCV